MVRAPNGDGCVGAGGGAEGNGAAAAQGSVNIGGTGSSSGDGGPVTVAITSGSVETGKNATANGGVVRAFGVLAQSVGGGGLAGNVRFGAESNQESR